MSSSLTSYDTLSVVSHRGYDGIDLIDERVDTLRGDGFRQLEEQEDSNLQPRQRRRLPLVGLCLSRQQRLCHARISTFIIDLVPSHRCGKESTCAIAGDEGNRDIGLLASYQGAASAVRIFDKYTFLPITHFWKV